jgi:Tol biopolymer transport system component
MRRIPAAVGLVAALSLLCAALAAPVRDPVAKEKSTKLLYPTIQEDRIAIILMDLSGGDPKTLTEGATDHTDPAWSRDGKKIAFTKGLTIHVMDADGGKVRQLTNQEKCSDRLPAWSPDGKKIAFCREFGNNWQVYVMDADGSNQKNLTETRGKDADPAWSPDGKKIAFASNRSGGGYRVYVMDADGANVKDLSGSDNPQGYTYPAWSHDGKKIYFTDAVEDALEVFVCDADGSNKKQLTKLGGTNTHAACSPDGKRVAFQHFAPDGKAASLYVMDSDGSNPKEVLKGKGPIEGGRPAWKPK